MSPFLYIAVMSAYSDIVFHNARSGRKLAAVVRGLRVQRGLTQDQLAKRARVSRQWVVAIESAKHPRAELGLVMRVLDALDASLYVRDDLSGEDG